jgi:hypothetical protein
VDLQEIDTSYWKYLEGISYHHLKGYLKQLDAEEYFDELFPLVRKKLQACAAVRVIPEKG